MQESGQIRRVRKETRELRDHLGRALQESERNQSIHHEKFKELLFTVNRIYSRDMRLTALSVNACSG
jgi:hypothetical protein